MSSLEFLEPLLLYYLIERMIRGQMRWAYIHVMSTDTNNQENETVVLKKETIAAYCTFLSIVPWNKELFGAAFY